MNALHGAHPSAQVTEESVVRNVRSMTAKRSRKRVASVRARGAADHCVQEEARAQAAWHVGSARRTEPTGRDVQERWELRRTSGLCTGLLNRRRSQPCGGGIFAGIAHQPA
jgi:hypothetical protein